jgi:hypothetical protein
VDVLDIAELDLTIRVVVIRAAVFVAAAFEAIGSSVQFWPRIKYND